jgi:uncharacterized protein YegL
MPLEVKMESDLLDQAEFAENPEPRCPVVLVLDTSGSMQGAPIQELNQGLVDFSAAIRNDPLASLRVEVAIVTFGGSVHILDLQSGEAYRDAESAEHGFVTGDAFEPPNLRAGGGTPMGTAVLAALDLLRERKEIYKQYGIDYFRPWMFVITDGNPTDSDWRNAAAAVRQEEARKGVIFYGVGVERADMRILAEFSEARPPLKLRGLAFGELFQWLSRSLSVIAHSRPGEQAPLPPVGWGSVDTSHS